MPDPLGPSSPDPSSPSLPPTAPITPTGSTTTIASTRRSRAAAVHPHEHGADGAADGADRSAPEGNGAERSAAEGDGAGERSAVEGTDIAATRRRRREARRDEPVPPPPTPARHPALRLALLVVGVVAVGLLTGRSIMIMIAALVVMILLHELGHFLVAKWSGMKVTEFFLGFGPRLWSFRRGETEYGVKAIPAGAYVKIVGMSSYEEVDPADEARTYRQQTYPRRLAVAVAGSSMHFLIAAVLVFVLLAGFGTPGGVRLFESVEPSGWRVGEVLPASAAEAAGLREGDRVLSVAGSPVPDFEDLGDVVRPRAGSTVPVVVERDGGQLALEATLGEASEDGRVIGRLGVRPRFEVPPTERVGLLEAVPDTLADFGSLTWGTVRGIGSVFSPSGVSNFAQQVMNANESPQPAAEGAPGGATTDDESGRLVSIVGATQLGARLLDDGAADFLRFLVVLNVFIGLFNLVPLLPLDGGHVAIATYERIREIGRGGRRYYVDVTKLLPLAYAVVVVLVLIGVSSVYLDVVDPIAP
jgi:membrane-associated protease RseP (regulator of RpoE activity)